MAHCPECRSVVSGNYVRRSTASSLTHDEEVEKVDINKLMCHHENTVEMQYIRPDDKQENKPSMQEKASEEDQCSKIEESGTKEQVDDTPHGNN